MVVSMKARKHLTLQNSYIFAYMQQLMKTIATLLAVVAITAVITESRRL